jgi:hypothetical protein
MEHYGLQPIEGQLYVGPKPLGHKCLCEVSVLATFARVFANIGKITCEPTQKKHTHKHTHTTKQ